MYYSPAWFTTLVISISGKEEIGAQSLNIYNYTVAHELKNSNKL